MTKCSIIILAAIAASTVLFCVVGWSISWYYDRRGGYEPVEIEDDKQ